MKLYSFFHFLKRHQTVISNRGENETAYSQKHDRYAVQKWLKFMLDLMILNVFFNLNDSVNYFANCSMHYKNGRMQISVHCSKKKKKRDGKKPEDDLIHPD